MGRCNNKVKYTCGDVVKATCVDYEGTVNNNSSLKDEKCLDIEQTTQDIYNQLGQIDVSKIDDCLDYAETNGKIQINKVVVKHGEEICELKEQIKTLQETALCNLDITKCGLDFKCLVADPCGTGNIKTLADLLQAMINKICPI